MNKALPTRRWLQFGLGTLFLLVTILAVWLGWWMRATNRQRQSIAAIKEQGGWVFYDYQIAPDGAVIPGAASWVPKAILSIVGEDFFHNIVDVNMVYDDNGPQRVENSRMTDAALYHLDGFAHLQSVALTGNQASDDGLAQLARRRTLRRLYMWDAENVSDAGVAHLASLSQLEFIHLNGSRIGDESLRILSALPKLSSLSLQENHITDAGLAHLKGMRQLKSLWVGLGDGDITDEGVVYLTGLKNLESLDLQGTRVTIAGLAQLKTLTKLTEVDVDVVDVPALQQIFPNCSFSYIQSVPAPAAAAVSNNPEEVEISAP